jgi:tripartite ATP-independent transporter DctM subunit
MGVIIPPSILMVVWGGVISVSIGGLFLAGVLPGVLMSIAFMVVVYIYARRRGYPVFPRPTRKELASVVGQAILPILTPGIIVGGIVGGFFTPTEASVVAVLYAMFLGVLIYRKLGFKELRETLYDSGRFAAISLFCIGTASAFGWLLAYFHIPQLFVNMVAGWGGSITTVGLITALCFLVIGCFIDAIPAIIIVGTILAPLAQSVGMHPIHFAIIGVISIAYGLVTPPYGLCLMIACTVGGIKIKEAIRDTAILFIPMLGVLMIVILAPDAMLWLPRLLMPTLVK